MEEEVLMEKLFLSCLGAFSGILTQYHSHKKKCIPLIEFVPKNEKEKTLNKNGIYLTESTVCAVCNEKITINNLGQIIILPHKKIFICNKKQCMTVNKIKIS